MTFSQVFQRNSPKSWGGGGGLQPPPPQPFGGSTPGEEEIEDGTIFDLGICE